MVVGSILVVCVGNICRSPTGERLLRARLPGRVVESAGLAAVAGHPADPQAVAVAAEEGLSLEGHVARQFTAALAAPFGLILVMEAAHRQQIGRAAPQLLGRTMLFDHWSGADGIADPFQRPRAAYEAAFLRLREAADAWALRLRERTPE